MYQVEIYGRIRRAVLVEGRSQRSVAREFGLARVTVRKMLGYSIPPGYRRKEPVKRPKLGPWMGVIDAILEEDKSQPAKQRHTAQRIFDRLRAEHGFPGGYTIVKDYVRAAGLRHREVFIPLAHVAGTAHADFGEALVIVGGEERKAHYLAIDLPHSDDGFVMAFPAETTEAFLEGHIQAFAYFGGVPISILYDNTKLAVARILGDGTRQKTRAFSELQTRIPALAETMRIFQGQHVGQRDQRAHSLDLLQPCSLWIALLGDALDLLVVLGNALTQRFQRLQRWSQRSL
jgi:transposase